MIQGNFGTQGEIFFPIELITGDGLSLLVDTMLDTGFTEYLAINKQDAQGLNWVYFDQEELLTAQGLATFDLYVGKVLIDEQEFDIPVFAGENIQEILLGSKWLKQFDLISQYQQNYLTLCYSNT
jgi:predicted aspartyl protease